jgi:hypothetical protein
MKTEFFEREKKNLILKSYENFEILTFFKKKLIWKFYGNFLKTEIFEIV